MHWNKWIRQFHRWLSIAFTLAVIANLVVMGQEKIALWVGLLTLLPLALLLITGLYMFVRPHAQKGRAHKPGGISSSD
jgi:amino acid permease